MTDNATALSFQFNVLGALNSNALVTLEIAKDFLDIASSNTDQDTKIARFINAASQMISNYCNREFELKTNTEYYDGRSTNAILLHQYPAYKPSSVKIDNDWVFDSTSEVSSNDFDVYPGGWLVAKSQIFIRGTKNIKVTYNSGYQTIPSDLQEACLMLVEYLYMHRNDRRSGVTTKSKNGENISYTPSIPQNIKDMLVNYVKLDFPAPENMVNNR